MSKPYVVSADVRFLVNEWAGRKGFKPVPDWCFKGMREEFSGWMREMFKGNFEFISEDELSNGLNDLAESCCLPVISLDRVYFCSEMNLDITRLVDVIGNDCGVGHRGNTSLCEQLRILSANGVKDVALVDDVIYSGNLIEKAINMLFRSGIHVSKVFAGIGIAEGIQRIKDLKVEVKCVRSYPEVIDEVCERDFYPGVPMCGRSLIDSSNIGAPYLLPFGNPAKWASIPKYFERDFSIRCIGLAKDLFHQIGHSVDPVRPVRCCDLDRGIVGLPKDETEIEKHLGHIQDQLAAGFDWEHMETHNI